MINGCLFLTAAFLILMNLRLLYDRKTELYKQEVQNHVLIHVLILGCRVMRRSGIWNRNVPTNSKLDVRFLGNEQIITWKQTAAIQTEFHLAKVEQMGKSGKTEASEWRGFKWLVKLCQWCYSLNDFIAWQSKQIWPYVGWCKKHSDGSKLTSNIQWSM